mmetsp:Transcript_79967/g.154564  ORF Transcript_79967/g.154564 Transcript_79967/m.154564 type:complete len:81 (+) Transcript_79967:2093-2335(+)
MPNGEIWTKANFIKDAGNSNARGEQLEVPEDEQAVMQQTMQSWLQRVRDWTISYVTSEPQAVAGNAHSRGVKRRGPKWWP